MPKKKLGATAKFYRKNPESYRKKLKADRDRYHTSSAHKKKRAEAKKKRRELKKKGVNLEGKDIAHTSKGLRVKDRSANRGSTSDSVGDRRSRGKKKTKRKS